MKVQIVWEKIIKISLILFPVLVLSVLPADGYGTSKEVETSEKKGAIYRQFPVDKALQDQWGIELTALRLTAANHMVDFRYRVLDAKKASPLFKRQTKPFLVHEKSGKVLAVPNTAKVGSLRNSNKPQEGRIYWMFFGNNGAVKYGDKVSVVIGDFRVENLVVQ